MPGSKMRTDIVEVYVFRRGGNAGVDFLQLRRRQEPLAGTWQPVMGHMHEGETATQTALRELFEETGCVLPATADDPEALPRMWQLEPVNTFYLASRDAVMLCPGFAVEVAADFQPQLNHEHDQWRWVARDHVDRDFLWPGQRAAVAHIVRDLLPADSPVAPRLRVFPAGR